MSFIRSAITRRKLTKSTVENIKNGLIYNTRNESSLRFRQTKKKLSDSFEFRGSRDVNESAHYLRPIEA